LSGWISSYNDALRANWDRTLAPVAFSAELHPANSHRGYDLFTQGNLEALSLTLDSYQEMGIQAVTVKISFPILYPSFHQSAGEYQQFLNFYTELARDIRENRKLKLIVDSQAIFSDGNFSDLDVADFYDSLTFAEYQAGRRHVIRTIAEVIRPNYLLILMEPDTEALQTGKPMNDPITATKFVQDTLNDLQSSQPTPVLIGAGTGTWHPRFREFFERFAYETELDILNVHIYPVSRDRLLRTLDIAEIARKAGKRLAITEAWLQKRHDVADTGRTVMEIFGRDPYEFWGPLDQAFLAVLVKYAHAARLEFISPFWSNYFYAYLDYDKNKNLLPEQRLTKAFAHCTANLKTGRFTETAITYSKLIGGPLGR